MRDAASFEGQIVDHRFPLQRYLGGSVHSAVFLTAYDGEAAAIKFVPSGAAHLAAWEAAAQLKHPALQRIFAGGEYRLGDTDCDYVVTEYADDNLAPAVAVKHLTPDEAREMVMAAAGALAYLHGQGWAHGHIQASNILGIGNRIVLSSDGMVRQPNEDPAADCLALGNLLRQVIPSLPTPFLEIVQGATHPDPDARWTASMIESHVRGGDHASAVSVASVRDRRWLVPAIAIAVLVLAGVFWFARTPRPVTAPESPAKRAAPAPKNLPSGPDAVVKQVLPEIPQAALDTITGRVRINIRVKVARSGSVDSAELEPPQASKYFTDRVLTAARQWQFRPGPAPREWILRFELTRDDTRVSASVREDAR